MFEVIGFLVVAIVIFAVIKRVFVSGIQTTFLKARDKAVSFGVPFDFASNIIDQPELLNARREIAKADKDVASLDAYQQYALAILTLYKSRTNVVLFSDFVQSKLRHILVPQIDSLNEENIPIQANIPTFVYVMTLAVALTPARETVSTEQVRIFLRGLLSGDEYSFNIDNASSVIKDSSNLPEMIEYLRPQAQSEIDAGSGDYLVRVSKKGDPADLLANDNGRSSGSPLEFLDA